MRIPLLLPSAMAFCLAGCSGQTASDEDVDVAAAASQAQSDIDNYAAAHPNEPVGRATPAVHAKTTASRDPAPIPIVADAGPRDIVQRYVDAIAARRFAAAWSLWEGGGQASGMTQAAFAASFDTYASFDAKVGMPSDEDAGAGQRYVTVPVTATGMLRSGGPFRLEGPIIMHRVADGIESSEPEAHGWRIRSSELKPRPLAVETPQTNPR